MLIFCIPVLYWKTLIGVCYGASETKICTFVYYDWSKSFFYIYVYIHSECNNKYDMHNVTGWTRCETCRYICKLYSKTCSKTQAGSKHQQTGIAQARQRAILGQAWVFDQLIISRGLEKRGGSITWAIIQTRYKQSQNGETRVIPRYTGRNQETRRH